MLNLSSIVKQRGKGLSSFGKQFSYGWDSGRLQLGNQLVHKPLGVGTRVEIVVVNSFDKNLRRLRTYPWDVLLSCVVRACLVRSGNEHWNWDLLDVLERNERCLEFASEPLFVRLFFLEAFDLRVAIHRPINFRLDTLTHLTGNGLVIVANPARKVVA